MLNNNNNNNNNNLQYSTMSPNLSIEQTQQQQQISLQQQSPNIINIKKATTQILNPQIKLIQTTTPTSQPQRIILQQQQQTPVTISQIQSQQLINANNNNNQNIPFLISSNNQQQQQQQPQQPQQIYLNLNNRIVPIQTVNIANKQQQQQQQQHQQQTVKLVIPTTSQQNDSNINRILVTTANNNSNTNTQSSSLVNNVNNSFIVLQSTPLLQNVINNNQQSQQSQKLYIVNNNSNSNTNISQINEQIQLQDSKISNKTNLAAEIAEKMKTLEQLQLKLRTFQQKISSIPNGDQTFKIQSALTQNEQLLLRNLLQKRNEVQSEIQQLKQKLMSPHQINGDTSSSSSSQIIETTQIQPQQQQQIQIIKSFNDINLTDKIKVLRNIQQQIQQIKDKDTNLIQQENKIKYQTLIQKQNELQTLIIQEQQQQQQQQQNRTQQNNSTINYILSRQSANETDNNKIFTVTGTNTIKNTLNNRLNNNNGITISQVVSKTSSSSSSLSGTNIKIKNVPIITTTTTSTQLQSLTGISPKIRQLTSSSSTNLINTSNNNNNNNNNKFNLTFYRVLNYDDLILNGLINKNTDETILKHIKTLDDKLFELPIEKQQAFAKNQIKLVTRYLEQYQPKYTIKSNIRNQLQRDQELALNPEIKTSFVDKSDAIKRLSRYHVFQHTTYEPSNQEFQKFDDCFEKVSERLVKTADAMKKRFHLLTLGQMQRTTKASEDTLLLKLFVDDLKKDFEDEKLNKDKLQEDLLKRRRLNDDYESNLIKRIKYEFKNYIENEETKEELVEEEDEELEEEEEEHEDEIEIKPRHIQELATKQSPLLPPPPVKLKIKLIKTETEANQMYRVSDEFINNDQQQLQHQQYDDQYTEDDELDEDEDESSQNYDYEQENANQNSSSCFDTFSNRLEQHETIQQNIINNCTNTNNQFNDNFLDDSTLNMNLSCLDDFILNEDELAVQSLLDI